MKKTYVNMQYYAEKAAGRPNESTFISFNMRIVTSRYCLWEYMIFILNFLNYKILYNNMIKFIT